MGVAEREEARVAERAAAVGVEEVREVATGVEGMAVAKAERAAASVASVTRHTFATERLPTGRETNPLRPSLD